MEVFAVLWLFALALALFPVHVHRFYASFIGEGFTRRNTPKTVRIIGILWLIFLAFLTLLAYFQKH